MVEAYSTFSGLGFLALQVGRQKIPVVRTQAKNSPSNDRSRSTSARYISVGVGSNIMWTRIRAPVYCALPEIERAIPAAAPAVEQLAVQSRHDADGHNRARGMSDAQHPGTDLAQRKSARLEHP